MTNKPPSQTYPGLKALLISSGLGASLLGVYMLANRDATRAAQEVTPTPLPTATPAPAVEIDVRALQPIPTALRPYVLGQQTPQPTTVAAPQAAPPVSGGQPTAGAQPSISAVPTAIAVGPLPPLPQPAAPPMQSAGRSSSS